MSRVTTKRPAAKPEEQLDAVGQDVLGLAENMFAQFRGIAAQNGLSHQMAGALLHLDRLGQIRVTDLARTLTCDAGNLSGTLDRLGKAGFVERVVSDADRRVRLMQLTGKGRRVAAQVKSQLGRTSLGDAFRRMDPSDRSQFCRLLKSLNATLDRER